MKGVNGVTSGYGRFLSAALLATIFLGGLAVVPHAAAATTNGFDFTGYVGPSDVPVPAYTATPAIPPNFTATTNTVVGYLTEDGAGAWGFANGTSYYWGTCVFGACGEDYAPSQDIEPFTAALSPLNNNGVPCGAPYATVFALAAATLTVPSGTTMYIDFEMDDGAAMYIAPISTMTFTSVFGSTTYGGGAIRPYGTSVDLTAGTYLIVIEWYNSCSEGAIAAQFSGLPAGSTFTPSPYLTPARNSGGGVSSGCEQGGYCATSAVVFSADGIGGATVTLSSPGQPTLSAQTSSSASTSGICSLPVNGTIFGCSAGETGQFIIVTGSTYSYTVAFPSSTTASGTVTVSTSGAVQVVKVAPG